jgi:hypothetical protein
LKTKDWPYAVIDFYLGRRSLEEMRAAAEKPTEAKVHFRDPLNRVAAMPDADSTVLVIDDDPDLRASVGRLLRSGPNWLAGAFFLNHNFVPDMTRDRTALDQCLCQDYAIGCADRPTSSVPDETSFPDGRRSPAQRNNDCNSVSNTGKSKRDEQAKRFAV